MFQSWVMSQVTQVIQTGVLQDCVLAPLLFLLYINDLNKSIKKSRAFHFPDDLNILLSNKSLELLAKKLNQDLKNLSQWAKANKLYLNVKRTELIIYQPKNTKLDYGIEFKLTGRRLTPISTKIWFQLTWSLVSVT